MYTKVNAISINYLDSAISSRHSFRVSGNETDPSLRKFNIIGKCFPLRSIKTHPIQH